MKAPRRHSGNRSEGTNVLVLLPIGTLSTILGSSQSSVVLEGLGFGALVYAMWVVGRMIFRARGDLSRLGARQRRALEEESESFDDLYSTRRRSDASRNQASPDESKD